MRIERDGHVLEAEVDMVEVTTMGPEYRPDPAWLYVDSEGHEHRWVDGAVPTCERLYALLHRRRSGNGGRGTRVRGPGMMCRASDRVRCLYQA